MCHYKVPVQVAQGYGTKAIVGHHINSAVACSTGNGNIRISLVCAGDHGNRCAPLPIVVTGHNLYTYTGVIPYHCGHALVEAVYTNATIIL
ncbi:hypothetical protein D3C86_1691330 [compost metagenome]